MKKNKQRKVSEKTNLWLALAVTVGWVLFLILWIFPQFKDQLQHNGRGGFSSAKASLLLFSCLFIFIGTFMGLEKAEERLEDKKSR